MEDEIVLELGNNEGVDVVESSERERGKGVSVHTHPRAWPQVEVPRGSELSAPGPV